MNTYTCNSFTGHYPVGSAAVVRAKDAAEAADMLNRELRARKLNGDAMPQDMIQFPDEVKAVRILVDGDY
jgi:hypothetical protein